MNAHEGEKDGDQGEHAAYREVNAATDDHQRHPARQDPEHGRLPQRVPMRANFEECPIRVEHASNHDDKQEG